MVWTSAFVVSTCSYVARPLLFLVPTLVISQTSVLKHYVYDILSIRWLVCVSVIYFQYFISIVFVCADCCDFFFKFLFCAIMCNSFLVMIMMMMMTILMTMSMGI